MAFNMDPKKCPMPTGQPVWQGLFFSARSAYQVINRSSSLPAVCGRVCPQESQCEGKCTRGIKNEPVGIGRL